MRRTRVGFALTCLLFAELAVFYASADPHEFKKMTAGVRRRCLAETKTTADIVDDVEIGVFPEGDDKLKCYFKCVIEKFNMFTKNDELNYNLMKKIVPEDFKEIALEMIDSCTGITGSNRCEIAYSFMKCMYYANPVAFFVV